MSQILEVETGVGHFCDQIAKYRRIYRRPVIASNLSRTLNQDTGELNTPISMIVISV